jgi:hypothetical protein
MKSFWKPFLTAACAVVMMTTFAAADTPGKHPAYLHALSDLRQARETLNYDTGSYRLNEDERLAIEQIDTAIREVQEAAIGDGKPMRQHFDVDARLSHSDRLHQAMDLLKQARADIDQHESDSYTRGLKEQALHHIDMARKAVHDATKKQHKE